MPLDFKNLDFKHNVTERFLRYVVIDTQSDPASPTCPSTEKQKNLGRLLAQELQAIGVTDAHIDQHGYVYGTIPATSAKKVPVICFCSHMDTSPDCIGANVKPQVVRNYRGGDIALPGDPAQVIRAAEHPALADQIGNDIVTTDGTTLLGADNKAGVAEIMDAAEFLMRNPQIKHGAIKDPVHARRGDRPRRRQGRPEEARRRLRLHHGRRERRHHRGRDRFPPTAPPSRSRGSAPIPASPRGAWSTRSRSLPPVVDRLPKRHCSPETTEGREGFVHPTGISGALESARIDLIVRDFTEQGLKQKEALLESIVREVMKDYPRSTYKFEVRQQYRNMKAVIDRHPEIVDYAVEAIRRAGLEPIKASIRGGTDGSRLSFMGLPCPNILPASTPFIPVWNG
jgi:tripeptide aminopeptidase